MHKQNRRPARAGGVVGDLFSVLGLVMIIFTLFKLWQEGPEALWVTVSPNRLAYQRRLGYTPLPELPPQQKEFSERVLDDPGHSQPVGVEVSVPIPVAPTLSELPPILTRGIQPVRIRISKIGLDVPIVEVGAREVEQDGRWIIAWETADSAAGHLAGTAKPGAPGNVVLSGHNNIRGQVFRHLDRLIPGDEVELVGENGERFRYVVREAVIVPEVGEPDAVRDENARYLLPTQDERLTLISCWPYWTNTHRVIVVAWPTVG